MRRAHPPSAAPAPATLIIQIDRMVIDEPALAPADTARFERALSADFALLVEARQPPAPRIGGARPAASGHLPTRSAAGGDRVANLARQVAHSLFQTLVEGGR